MATISETQQLYVAYFGRPADPAGLDYWVSTGITTKNFAAAMYAQPEFQQVNAALSVTNQVNALYLNLFGRSGDTAGLLYWTQQINTGVLTLASIANDLIFAANNNQSDQSKADKIALDNKTATAVAYTTNVRAASASLLAYNPTSTTPWVTGPQFLSAVTYLATVIATAPTAAVTTAAVATMTAIPALGQTFTLTTSIETVPATGVMAANSSITGVINGAAGSTFQTGDIINGNATSNAAVTVATANANTLVAINTLQAINFRTLVADVVNAQLFSNVANVGTTGSNAVLSITNGDIASTYSVNSSVAADGLNVTLRAAQIGGTSDTLRFNVLGAGNPASTGGFTSALTSGTGIETISVATAGSNSFSVSGSTVAATDSRSLVVTGAGANTIDALGLTQANLFNLSGSSGVNALRLDNVLTSSSTVTGGSGADTLRVAPTGGNVIANLSVSAVETLRLGKGTTGGSLLFAAAPNFSTVRVDGDNAEGAAGVGYTISSVGSFATLDYRGDGELANANGPQQLLGLTVNNSFSGTADTVAVRFSNGGTAITGANGYTVRNSGGTTGVIANGVETFNVTLADLSDASASSFDFASNTLQSVSVTGLGTVTSTITAQNASANGSALATINLSGLTSTGVQSAVTLAVGSIGTNTVVTGSAGGVALVIAAEVAGDTLIFNGGAGIDVINPFSVGFAGTIVANLGGGANLLNTGNVAQAVSITANTAAAVNTITVGTAGSVSYIASGAGSTNTITAAGSGALSNITAAGSTVATALTGSAQADTLVGGSGNDTITGGAAADTITGGAAADRFVFTTNATIDTVTDFVTGATGDVSATSISSLALGSFSADNAATGAAGAVRITAVDAFTAGTTALTVGAANSYQVIALTGGNLANIAAAEAALEGASGAITGLGFNITVGANNRISVIFSDGVNSILGYYTFAATLDTAAFAGALTQVATFNGVTSAASFLTNNFAALA